MICPKCSRAPDDYITGEWVSKEIDGYPRRVCSTCGYVDECKCWVSGVYRGPPGQEFCGYKTQAGSLR